jgi:hypothetical protein
MQETSTIVAQSYDLSLESNTMAAQLEQHPRLWLDLTDHKPQDWTYPKIHLKAHQPGKYDYQTSPSPVPQDASTKPERLLFANRSASSMSGRSLPNMQDHAAGQSRTGQIRAAYEKPLPDVPHGSSSKNRARPIGPRHVTFSDLPSQPMIGNQLNRGTRNSEFPTPVREADVSSFVERLDYAGSNTYPYRKSSLPTDSLESFCPFNTRRAEHVIAIKKRELNADVAALKMLKSHPGSLGEQCRRFLHDSLNLSDLQTSPSMNKTTINAQYDKKGTRAKTPEPKCLKRIPCLRPRRSLDETTYVPYKHNTTRPDLYPSTHRPNSEFYTNQYCSCDDTSTGANNLGSLKSKPRVVSTPPLTPRRSITAPSPSPDPLPLTSISTPNSSPQATIPPSSPMKIKNSRGSTVLDADRVIIEVLRRIASRMEASTRDERIPILKVTESLTREVLCICKELTDGTSIKII